MDDQKMMQGKKCSCPHHSMVPLLVALFGLDFLGGALGWWSQNTVNIVWPILVLLAGLMKMMGGRCKCC